MTKNFHLLLLTACLAAGTATAQFADPTRPPNALSAADQPGGVAAPVESGLQTVILRRNGKSVAVINGRQFKIGDKLGDKRILSIGESEVVLKGPGGREVLKVMPAIEKTPVQPPAAAKPRARRTTEGTREK